MNRSLHRAPARAVKHCNVFATDSQDPLQDSLRESRAIGLGVRVLGVELCPVRPEMLVPLFVGARVEVDGEGETLRGAFADVS